MSGELCSNACGWCGRCDADYRGLNAICPQCGDEYHRGRDDDGWLCDACCDQRDAQQELDEARQKGVA